SCYGTEGVGVSQFDDQVFISLDNGIDVDTMSYRTYSDGQYGYLDFVKDGLVPGNLLLWSAGTNSVANACSSVDTDGDGIPDVADNCPSFGNPFQFDSDSDGRGDYCDFDPLQVVVRNEPPSPARGLAGEPPGDPELNLRVTEPNTGNYIGADSLGVITDLIGVDAEYYQLGANDSVVIDHVKYGDYIIEIIPEAGRALGGQYTIGIRTDGTVEERFGPFDSPFSGEIDTLFFNLQEFLWGDCDMSGSVNIADVTMMIARIFAGGPPCNPLGSGDADCSASFNIADVTHMIAFIFSSGAQPGCPN
ncbi:MAG TPA: thrombospondin type 3 repeat-containing protein, partial [candidate division Zixibacteria bacterium]|nr:thrombospondin type 3 repeat-containing protein [candidate division Zixibacteria bacterium]